MRLIRNVKTFVGKILNGKKAPWGPVSSYSSGASTPDTAAQRCDRRPIERRSIFARLYQPWNNINL
jgi:hypothetical protein